MSVLTPPVKCQGIKTKLVPTIKALASEQADGTWIEPFCGSGVVALNVQPQRALLADTNQHIIRLYRSIQASEVTPAAVREFLQREGEELARQGEAYYYEVRARFNAEHDPLDFLFLSRACFNGVMRFNQKGAFNVPFCRKPKRFSPAYITKIVNQVQAFADVVQSRQWRFEVADFGATLAKAKPHDFVYADPPYAGRSVDYYNTWNGVNEVCLVNALKALPCRFLLSTWHGNTYRDNHAIRAHWAADGFSMTTVEHFYHVGSTEDLRHRMTEALIANYPMPAVAEHDPSAENEAMEQLSLSFS